MFEVYIYFTFLYLHCMITGSVLPKQFLGKGFLLGGLPLPWRRLYMHHMQDRSAFVVTHVAGFND